MGDALPNNSDNSTSFSVFSTIQLEIASWQFMELQTNTKVSIVWNGARRSAAVYTCEAIGGHDLTPLTTRLVGPPHLSKL